MKSRENVEKILHEIRENAGVILKTQWRNIRVT